MRTRTKFRNIIVLTLKKIRCVNHHSDDGSSTHLSNVGIFQREYTMLYPTRLSSSAAKCLVTIYHHTIIHFLGQEILRKIASSVWQQRLSSSSSLIESIYRSRSSIILDRSCYNNFLCLGSDILLVIATWLNQFQKTGCFVIKARLKLRSEKIYVAHPTPTFLLPVL
jgi:hypothetical protein